MQYCQTLLLQALDDRYCRAAMTVPPVFLSDVPGAACRRKSPRSSQYGPSSPCSPWRPNVPLRILNNDAKTVVRLLFEVDTFAAAPDAPPFASCLWLKPVRGYEKEAKKFSQWLINQGGPYHMTTAIFRDSRRSRNNPELIPPRSAYICSRLSARMKRPK